jgi:hypothetical protein
MSQKKSPRFIGITIEEVKSQSPLRRRKVHRAFVHNSGILYGQKGQAKVEALLNLNRGQGDALRHSSDKSSTNS